MPIKTKYVVVETPLTLCRIKIHTPAIQEYAEAHLCVSAEILLTKSKGI